MIYQGIISGLTVDLRAVDVDDAEFILKLRNDQISRFIHAVNSSVDTQKEWIRIHQKMDDDYYFLALDKKGNKIGTAGLSSIHGKVGETSRLVSFGDPVQNTEINLLLTDFTFGFAGLDHIEGYVGAENISVISLQKKFGYVFESELKVKDGMLVRYAYLNKADYEKRRPKIVALIEKACKK